MYGIPTSRYLCLWLWWSYGYENIYSIHSLSLLCKSKSKFTVHIHYINIIYILCLTVVINYEEDIAMYTIKIADDPETYNRVLIYRPQKNIVSQLELISLWEKKTGKTFNRIHVPEDEIVKLSESKKFLLTRYFLIFDIIWLLALFIWLMGFFCSIYIYYGLLEKMSYIIFFLSQTTLSGDFLAS